ncbi:MAG: site-specific integrase [Actinomycetota bacterium]|nr:site-specific integrase [Actinomycetota bacterium]
MSECAGREPFRAFRVALDGDFAYWTVLDCALRRVRDLDAFLLYLRTGRGRTEATTESYARDLTLFEAWRCSSGRDLVAAAADLHLLVAHLKLTPIERKGRGYGRRRSNNRISHVLTAVRSFYRFEVATGRVSDRVLPLLWEVGDTRFLPEELKPEGGGVQYRAVPRHQLPREKNDSPDAVTREEAGRLLTAADHWRDRFLIVLLWHCGLRIGAALGLRRCDVHFMDNAAVLGCRIGGPHVHVVPRDNPNRARAKTHRPFSVPVPTEVVTVYEMYLLERTTVPAAAECDFTFVNLFHAPIGAPMRYATAHQLLHGLSTRAGLDRAITPHMFRHGTGRALVDSGVDVAVIKEILHHARLQSTGIYARPGHDRLRVAIDTLPPLPRPPRQRSR